MRAVAWLALVTVAVAAAIAANYVLLGYGRQRDDPVGRLTPKIAAEIAGRGIVKGAPTPRIERSESGERDRDSDD